MDLIIHHTCHQPKRNIPSAYQHPDIIDEYIRKELEAGNFVGPLSSPHLSNGQSIQVSRIGIIPKGHNTGKWRLITDLSFPAGSSVNDGIASQHCSLEYVTVDKVAALAMSLGEGALLAKIDIKSAYRLIPTHPTDRHLLGIRWRDKYYVDNKLPFGLRSAPKIFNAIADALEYCIRREGVNEVEHYLDDFITMGSPISEECASNLEKIKRISADLGIPLAEEKEEGPSTAITFLGIHLDTVLGTLSLPSVKIQRILKELGNWKSRRCCRRRELESLIGLLHHAARVVRPGRSFIQRLIFHLRGGRQDNHFIRLNKEARADIHWWQAFLELWNGVTILSPVRPRVSLTSDASGSWGCGAYSDNGWFQVQWPTQCANADISFKELLPIVLAVMAWGNKWRGYHVCCRCDNEAVVSILASRTSRNSSLMHLLRCLFFFEAYYNIHITASHIPGHTNVLADDLSRNRLSSFFTQAPHMHKLPAPLPLMGLDLLLDIELDWSSPAWMQLFRSIVL